jgi:hypothetical protein
MDITFLALDHHGHSWFRDVNPGQFEQTVRTTTVTSVVPQQLIAVSLEVAGNT